MVLFNLKIIIRLAILGVIFSANISEGGSANSFYKQGFKLSIEGKIQSAIQSHLKALKIEPHSAEVHHALGVLYFEDGAGAKAIDHFKKAESFYKNRNDKKAVLNLSIVKNNLEKAYKKFGLNPDDFRFDALSPIEVGWKPSGVGFLIGKQGHLFTSASVISGANKIRVRFPNGQTVPVKLIREFIVYKIAVLKLDDSFRHLTYPIVFEDNPLFKEGDSVYAMDFSTLGTTNRSLSRGIILKENALENSNKIVQLDLEVKKGKNGGPLFNGDGKLIGLILTKLIVQKSFSYLKDSPENASFAIKSPYLEKVLSRLLDSKKQIKNQTKDANLDSGINVNKVALNAINNFVFLEISN